MSSIKSEAQKFFEACAVEDWKFHKAINNKSGQASVIEVQRISDSINGVFRYLKRATDLDIKRFTREIKILTDKKFKRPNIINILAHGEEAPFWYISEKGDDFKDYWATILKQTKDINEIVRIGISIVDKILDGLIPLHEAGVVHHDIKPSNIVMVKGEPVLIDFGLVYSIEEDRITPDDQPVGNLHFSPDVMLHRTENVSPWFDVYMLSQFLVWMVADRSPKGWQGPLDWRYIKYSTDMQDDYRNALRAITARCSDSESGPQNATQLKELIKNLFPQKKYTGHIEDEKLVAIIESISKGKARSLIETETDLGHFETNIPQFEIFLKEILEYLIAIERKYNAQLPVSLNNILDRSLWIQQIKSGNKFAKNEQRQLCNFRCGGSNSSYFQINFHLYFFAKDENVLIPPFVGSIDKGNPLPNNFIPFCLRINTHSSSEEFRAKNMFQRFYIAMDNNGQLRYFDNRFMNEKEISKEELFSIIMDWVDNPDIWQMIQ